MGSALAVEETGTGEPLVLVHGLVADHRIWAQIVPALARERRVIAIDLPGFGASEPAGPGFALDAVASAIVAGLREHGVEEPYDLVGHSLGGGVVIELAAAHPTVVRNLTLVAPAGLRPLPPVIANLINLGGAWPSDVIAAATAFVPEGLARTVRDASLSAVRNGQAAATIGTVDLRPRLGEITAPIGVIWGESDLTVPIRGLVDLLAARPEARVIRMAGTGHVPMVERPDAFAEALLTITGPRQS